MRIEPVRDYLDSIGYKTIYVSSDFHHAKKEYVTLSSDIISIHTIPYKRNISLLRVISHFDFSRKVYSILCKEKPDLIYIKFPPNSLAPMAAKYKKISGCKLIFDVFDLWPESLPIPEKSSVFKIPLTAWKNQRDKNLINADIVFTECKFYKEVLKERINKNLITLYLTKDDINYEFIPAKENEFSLCYIGGINNIIDIQLIGIIVRKMSQLKSTILHIIGDGYKRDELIAEVENNGGKVVFHGIIYDEIEKYKIVKHCDYGINIPKESLKIALSIKSIEYFRAGLCVLNAVKYDTEKLISKYNAGINVNKSHFMIPLNVDVDQCKKNSRKIYELYFSKNSFMSTLDRHLNFLR